MYEAFYGLTGRPFQLTPDHRFFYSSPGHTRALAYLRYGLEQQEGFVVVTGGVGTGKTILALTLLDEIQPRQILGALLVTTRLGPEDLLRMVCAAFGLLHEGLGKAALFDALQGFARSRFSEGQRILLVLDEAHHLPAASLEELRVLEGVRFNGQSLFQTFLFGQDELRDTLRHAGTEQLRQRVIAAHHLEPLSGEETRAYIEYRLACVNWSGSPALADDVFDAVHAHCGGVPRRINTLCDRLFLFGYTEEKLELTQSDVGAVIGQVTRERVHGEELRGNGGDARLSRRVQGVADIGSRPAGADPGVLVRLAALEAELASLRQVVKKERQLLRKAILLQLDLDGYDELD
jgi:putative secretion ATPase (PEP-CTERM system associated)